MCAGEGGGEQKSVHSQTNPLQPLKEITMKLSHIAVAASFTVLALTQVHAEEYQGVLQFQSASSRSEIRAQAVDAAHASNPYSEGASSVVAAAPASPRDRAAVQVEARARAHAPNQNLRVEAFAESRVPSSYTRTSSMRQARADDATTVR